MTPARNVRRQARARAITSHPVDWTQPHNPDCKTASTIAELVAERDDGWMIDPRPCARCGTSATVSHRQMDVWLCLLCGQHGTLDVGERKLH